MLELSTSQQSIIGVLRNSLKLFKKTWLRLLPLAILMIMSMLMLHTFLPTPAKLSVQMKHILNKHLLVIAVLDVIAFWSFLVMFYRSYRIMIAADNGYRAAIAHVLRKIIPCLFAFFLYCIIVSLGVVCFVVPGIFLAWLLVFSVLAILIDDFGMFASFQYSAKLVWGNWWRTLVVLLGFCVVGFLFITVVVFAVDLFLVFLLHMSVAHAVVIMNVLAALLVSFLWILLTNVFVCQYYDLKLRYQLKAR